MKEVVGRDRTTVLVVVVEGECRSECPSTGDSTDDSTGCGGGGVDYKADESH